MAPFQVSDQQAHPNLHQTISGDSKDTAMIYNDCVVNCLTIQYVIYIDSRVYIVIPLIVEMAAQSQDQLK